MARNREHFSYIYVAESDGRFKIGRSANPAKRVLDLSTGCAHSISLALSLRVIASGASRAERRAHGYLAKYHVGGEWFEGDRRLILKEVKRAVSVTNAAQYGDKGFEERPSSYVNSRGYLGFPEA